MDTWYPTMVLICFSWWQIVLNTFSYVCWAISIDNFFCKVSSNLLLFLKLGYCSFLLMNTISLCIWDMSPLSYFCTATLHYLLTFLMMSSSEHKFFILMKFSVSVFFLYISPHVLFKKSLPTPDSWRSCCVLSSRTVPSIRVATSQMWLFKIRWMKTK